MQPLTTQSCNLLGAYKLPFAQHEVPPGISGVIITDLGIIAANFRKIAAHLPKAKSSAVVKANAYGIGMVPVSKALFQTGCRDFFVATVDEGIRLRRALPEVHIFVFNGVLPGTQEVLDKHKLIPVLNDLGQIDLWREWGVQQNRILPAALHLDTGMWRMGLPPQELAVLGQHLEKLERFDLRCILSHLACSEQLHHPLNARQLQRFQAACQLLPAAPMSLANSGGILLGPDYHFDLVRPGKALLGVGTIVAPAIGLQPAVQVYAQILQVRDMPAGHSIGYDAQYKTSTPIRLATLGMGYGDGIIRAFGNCGKVFIGGHVAPIVGRVSMDLIAVDASAVPEQYLRPGFWAEVVGEHITADEQAAAGGTISREIYTNFGERNHRIYRGET
ncbi:MAG: alanine racemase [Pseudomonadota bacterium]